MIQPITQRGGYRNVVVKVVTAGQISQRLPPDDRIRFSRRR